MKNLLFLLICALLTITGRSAVPPPIDLESFSYQCSGDITIIKWITSSENNCNYFILERSDDGVYFEPITTIAGSGNTNSSSSYGYIDNVSSEAYYRIIDVDYDGVMVYHEPIHSDCGTITGVVTPNPSTTDDVISIVVDYNFVKIIDMLGNEINAKIINNKIIGLSAGVYLVAIDGYYTTKLIIQ